MEKPKHKNELTTTAEPYSLDLELARLMDKMLANYPNQQISAETAAVWRESWTEIAKEFGTVNMNAAVKACMLSASGFPPLPGQILEQCRQRRSIENVNMYQIFKPNPVPTPEEIEEDRKYRALLQEKVREITEGKKIS